MVPAVDQVTRARQGRSFDSVAGEYERGRPGWPMLALERLATALELPASATVVDLGAGTGKLTRLLTTRFSTVMAVEPLAGMREQLAARVPKAAVYEGSAERLPLPDASVDAVFVADAFHWFDWPVALAEIARVLRPGGGLALLWHEAAGPWLPTLPDQVVAQLRQAAQRTPPGGVIVREGRWRQAFADSAFGPLGEDGVPYEHVTDRDGLIANLLSQSPVAGLPEAERAQLQAELVQLPEATYRRPLWSRMYWARTSPIPQQHPHAVESPTVPEEDAADSEQPQWCDRCGGSLHEGDHTVCRRARALEPPRFCSYCRRRMKVQVLPVGWRAQCVAHGELSQS
jgi:SAM-dependent methyltransferase